MKNSIGKNITINVFGESHGNGIGVVIDGLAPGISLDIDFINHQLDLRRPKGKISTSRHEKDQMNIMSGYFNGFTTGTPLCIIFENNDNNSNQYFSIKDTMRPSHADYTGIKKYLGYNDYRGGGHFSGRLTAPIVAAGAIVLQILKEKDIFIGTHISELGNIKDTPFSSDEINIKDEILSLNNKYFPTISNKIGEQMQNYIESIASEKDSIGGVLDSIIINFPVGIGEPMFDSIESVLSQYLFSIPGLKGIEFGLGFDYKNYKGSQVNDEFYYDSNIVKTKTNNNGGINGGISNGMPITIKSVIKPTPSIYKEQNTINIKTKENTKITIEGRHDPAIIHRARVVVDSVIALGLLDLIIERHGYLWMVNE
ncbi:chorismate synthase [Fusobacterium sp. PH5-44]|uniref:chorismate synthase n=1 Tax=unclassified Fusobacterium TaxID=2648384 RepID=UPI003D239455